MDVDYQGFAAQMGNNNRQAIASLMQLIQSNKESKRLEQKDAQARQLQDLQLAKLKEEQAYQEGLKKAMAAPQSTTELTQAPVQPLPSLATLGLNRPDYVPPPSAAPRTPQEQSDIEGLQANVTKYPGLAKLAGADARLEQMKAAAPTAQPQPSLASLGGLPEFAPQPPNVQAPMLPGVAQTTKTESPLQAGQRFAASQGRLEDAAKMVSLDDTVAQMGAKLKASGGDLAQYYEAKQSLDQGKEFMEAIKPYAKNPTMLTAMWPQIQKTFPKYASLIDPSQVKSEAGGVTVPLKMADGTVVPGKAVYQDAEGKTHIIDTIDKESMADKRLEQQMEMQRNQIEASDRRTAAQIAAADRHTSAQISAADRRAAMKEHKGGQGKILPAAQLEAIADMKRVKDVLAEAGADLAKSKVETGPVSGRLQALGSKVGMASDDFVNVQQKLQTAQNIMLKLRSGAAVTESEYSRFLKEYPTPNDPPAVLQRKLNNTLQYANTLADDKMGIYEEGGYRVPQSAKSGASTPTPAPKRAEPPAPKTFDALPSPKGLTGRTITDSHTGKRYRSDGKSWRPM